MVAAVSEDFFITDRSGDVTSWTSKEDKEFFTEIKAKHRLYVMGSRTHDAIPKPLVGDATRVVLTTRAGEYQDERLDNVIFENLSADEFVRKYEKNYTSCLLLGGSKVYTDFLKAGVVDELFLTIEPVLLKNGTPLLEKGLDLFSFGLSEVSANKLNSSGTVLTRYVVKK